MAQDIPRVPRLAWESTMCRKQSLVWRRLLKQDEESPSTWLRRCPGGFWEEASYFCLGSLGWREGKAVAGWQNKVRHELEQGITSEVQWVTKPWLEGHMEVTAGGKDKLELRVLLPGLCRVAKHCLRQATTPFLWEALHTTRAHTVCFQVVIPFLVMN